MRDSLQLQEIESIGEEEPEIKPEASPSSESSGTVIPIVQSVLCALLLVTLVVLKFLYPQTYQQVTNRYQSEMAQEIELPKWSGGNSKQAGSSLPSSQAPATAALSEASLQRV